MFSRKPAKKCIDNDFRVKTLVMKSIEIIFRSESHFYFLNLLILKKVIVILNVIFFHFKFE